MKTRKRYDESFKALVALEAVKGEKTLSELAAQFEMVLLVKTISD